MNMSASLYLFNPDNDLAMANNDENYQAPQSARRMADDLCTLPAWYASPGDSVVVTGIGEAERWLREETGGLLSDIRWHSFRAAPFTGSLKPWGWNPSLIKRLRQWGVDETLLPDAVRMAAIRQLSSRQQAVRLLPRFVTSSLFCGQSFYCTDLSQIEPLVCQWKEIVLKAPYSGSGKGLRLGRGVWNPTLANWCGKILRGQGGVVVEPLYDKVADFAMEFLVNGDEVFFVGYSLFRTDGNGAYKGNLLAADAEIEGRLARYVAKETLRTLRDEWTVALREWLGGAGYRGYLGVDMMVCRFDDVPFFRVHPCVEINLRMNMGVVARLFHDRFVKAGRTGTFAVEYWQDAEALRTDHAQQKNDSPLVVSEGRIVSGYLSLNPIGKGCHYRAWVRVE